MENCCSIIRENREQFDDVMASMNPLRTHVVYKNSPILLVFLLFSGTAGDSFSYHRYQAFTTKDHDNDFDPANCAVKDQGAWWYKNCYQSNLNGLYLNGGISGQGVVWYSWKNSYISTTRSEMKIRPKDFSSSIANNACPV